MIIRSIPKFSIYDSISVIYSIGHPGVTVVFALSQPQALFKPDSSLSCMLSTVQLEHVEHWRCLRPFGQGMLLYSHLCSLTPGREAEIKIPAGSLRSLKQWLTTILAEGAREGHWATRNYSQSLNNMGLGCVGPLICWFFFCNKSSLFTVKYKLLNGSWLNLWMWSANCKLFEELVMK